MIVTDSFGNEFFLQTFVTAVKVPSGQAGINFDARRGFHNDTVILDISFEGFVAEWNRTH